MTTGELHRKRNERLLANRGAAATNRLLLLLLLTLALALRRHRRQARVVIRSKERWR
jgi:hypothetical protein